MKVKSLLTAIVAALGLTASLPATAQQLPNSGFEEWKGSCGTSESLGSTTGMRTRPGDEPQNWNGSSVNQKVSGVTKEETLITKYSDGSLTAADLLNKYVGVKIGFINIGSVAPGYISLGTPWVYATSTVKDCDGGTYGGMSFTYRPDELWTTVKRDDNNNENSYIIAYSWSGTFISKIGQAGSPSEPRENVDRAICGKISPDQSGIVVSKIEHTFQNTGGWQTIKLPFNYDSSVNPEKINVIISAGDYWTRGNLQENTRLLVDDVKLIYYSRLASLKVKGREIKDFDSNTYSYTIDCDELPTASDISAECLGNSGSGVANIEVENRSATESVATITVTNKNGSGEGFEDIDGKTSHTYTVTFKKILRIDLISLTVNGVKLDGPFETTSTIPTNEPFTDNIIATASGNVVLNKVLGEKNGTNASPTRTLTVTHPDDNTVSASYNLSFLPYTAEIEHVYTENGVPSSPDENNEIAVGLRYSVAGGIKDILLKKSSGNVTATYGEVTDVAIAPKIKITVSNKDANPPIENIYTLVYNPPVSSRISGVRIGDTEYPVNTEDNTIDLTSLMPLPDKESIEPVYILPDAYQSADIVIDTENSTGSITVKNDEGNDYDNVSFHTYTLKLAPVSVSRPRTIILRNSEGNQVEWSPEFDSKHYEYKVRSFMPGNDDFEYEWFSSELNVSAERVGDEYSETPQIKLTFSNSDNGKDFDGETSHTYTLTFNKKTDEFRSNHLSEIRIADVPLEGFDRLTQNYSIATPVVDESDITWEIYEDELNSKEGTTVTVSKDENKAVITLHVRNEIANSSGQSERTYTLQFLPYYSRLAAVTAPDGSSVETLGLEAADGHIPVRLQWQIPKLPDTESDIAASLVFMNPTAGTTVHSVEANADAATATVTVSNEKPDADGLSTHTYTLTYDRPYYSRILSLMVNGVGIDGFDRNKFDYTIDGQMPVGNNVDVSYTFMPNSNNLGDYKIADKTIDAEAAKITVVVSNSEPDVDGLSTHTYTVQYSLPYFSRIESLKIGDIVIEDVPQDGVTPMVAPMQLPVSDEAAKALFAATFRECSGTPVIEYSFDRANALATLTVTNGGEKDPDGSAAHRYLVQFEPPYSSAAGSITIDGVAVGGFDCSKTEYNIDGEMPSTDAVAVVYAPGSGSCFHEITSDTETATITITVTNPGDGNGNYASSTVYVLHFDLPYFSRLAELSVKGAPVAGFDKDKFDYTIAGAMPAASEITATPMKASGTPNARISADSKTGIVTITVTNGGRADLDGKTEHVYTLHFDAPVNSRLASISIGGTPLAGFDPDTYSYNLSDITMPAEGEVKATAGSDKATVTISYDTENSTVTVKVSATAPDEDGLSEHTYTLRFKKSTEIPPAGGTTSVYEGTLTIMMMGEDITGGGQEAKVEITEENDGVCTFLLPNFSLDLGDGPSTLGDIKVENVSMTPDGNGGYTYSGVVKGLELAEGEIVADVTLSGTTDADGNAHMTIAVLWEGIAIDVEFNGKRTSTIPPPTPPEDEEWSDYDGTLSIEMGGSYIAENQPATVFITDATDGKCTFKLPDFSLDMEGTVLNLGDITVEDVTVSESADGTAHYTGFVSAMSFLEGEIIADINLTGTVDAAGNARMTIQVLWKQDGGEDIPINVEFNGKRNEIAWISYPGKLTIALEGYDITEGGKEATIKIAQTGDEGRYSFLLPDFSIALDAASEPAMIGNIQVDELTLTPMEGFDRYTGLIEKMSLAKGDIIADVKIDGTIATNGDVRVNVDVVWIMEEGKRVPILVKFTNVDEKPVTPERIAYSGVLNTSSSDGSGEREHNVTIYLSPSYGNRADMTIEGIDFPAASRAAAIGRTITVPGVALTTIANGMTSYDGAVSGIKYRDDMTLDITLHGFSNADNRFNLLLDINWIEEGLRLTGTFDGAEDTSAIDRIDGFAPESGDARTEYYDLRGVRVNPDNLRPGIYIRRSGNKTEKILIQ